MKLLQTQYVGKVPARCPKPRDTQDTISNSDPWDNPPGTIHEPATHGAQKVTPWRMQWPLCPKTPGHMKISMNRMSVQSFSLHQHVLSSNWNVKEYSFQVREATGHPKPCICECTPPEPTFQDMESEPGTHGTQKPLATAGTRLGEHPSQTLTASLC